MDPDRFDEFGVPKREDSLYASCYCEENIWQLCKAIKDKGEKKVDRFRVIFISNESKMIPLWHQKAGSYEDDGFVVWDYHVILLRTADGSTSNCFVYDLDTTLPFPCAFSEYFARAIRQDHTFQSRYQRKFRIISASDYLILFSSDRSHMLNAKGEWARPPPPWPCIQSSDHTNTIRHFWSMDPSVANVVNNASEVLDTRQLAEKFGSPG